MRSDRPRAAMPRLPLLLAMLGFALCAGCAATVATRDVPHCAELLDASGLLNETAGAPLPGGDVVGDWQVFGVQQTGQLEKANADKGGAGRLVRTCEDLHRAALARTVRPWWKFW